VTSTNTRTAVLADDRPGPAQAADPTAEVPRPCAIIRACAITSAADHRHPLLAAVPALAAQHRQRAEAHQLTCDPLADDHALAIAARVIAAADAGRTVLIDRIDQWACSALPDSRHAAVHTESFGRLVDRMVEAWTLWYLVKDREGPANADLASALLHHVSELSIGYDDLVDDLCRGRRRLPRHQNPLAA